MPDVREWDIDDACPGIATAKAPPGAPIGSRRSFTHTANITKTKGTHHELLYFTHTRLLLGLTFAAASSPAADGTAGEGV
jgi:hypothetical protein